MSTSFIILCALIAVLASVRYAKRRLPVIKTPEDLHAQLVPVDIDAFRNLTDPSEESFLQAQVSPREYRRLRRQRLRATMAYVSRVGHNATVLTRMGEEARRSADASVAEAGKKLLESALRLRLQTAQLKAKIYLQLIYPGISTPSGELVGQYEMMTRQGMLLGRLQYPTRGVSGIF